MVSLGRLRTDSFLVKNIWFMTATPQPLFVFLLRAALQQLTQAIVRSLPDGSDYPAGCIYDVSEGGGCALLLQTDGKARTRALAACD